MKDDEKRFLKDVSNIGHQKVIGIFGLPIPARTPRDIINEPDFYMHHKRAWYLLNKWTDKRWYEFGVTLDLGWLTEEGIKIAEGLTK